MAIAIPGNAGLAQPWLVQPRPKLKPLLSRRVLAPPVLGLATVTVVTRVVTRRSRARRSFRAGSCHFVGLRSSLRPMVELERIVAVAAGDDLGNADLIETSLALSAGLGLNSVPTVATLAFAIFCHESGHFVCARSVDLPAAEFAIGFGPELFTTAEPSPRNSMEESCEFTDAQSDLMRLERFSDGEVQVFVNDKEIYRGLPSFEQSSSTLECGNSGSCQVPEESVAKVETLLLAATETIAAAVAEPKETIFSLRALPIGGYVRFDERKVVKLENGAMATQLDAMSTLAQLWVYSGGVLTNMVVAFATLFAGALTSGVPESKPLSGIRVTSVGEDGFMQTGLRTKDVLLQIGDLDLHAPGQSTSATVDFIRKLPAGENVKVLLERAGQEMQLEFIPLSDARGYQRLGVQIVANAEKELVKAKDALDAAGVAANKISFLLQEQVTALKGLLNASGGTGGGEVVGPLGMIEQGSNMADSEGLIGLAMFFVTVNLNLALINVLPVPALDGGKITFAVVGKVLGKPVDEKTKESVETVFVFLVLIGIAGLTLKDFAKLVQP